MGKRVLVTGGSRGIGDAFVRQLASQGAEVAVDHRSDRAAEALVITDTTIGADSGWS